MISSSSALGSRLVVVHAGFSDFLANALQKNKFLYHQECSLTTAAPNDTTHARNHTHRAAAKHMRAWQISSYNEQAASSLRLAHEVPIPSITAPDDVLVAVHAASINPLDVGMANGYGQTIMHTLRQIAELRESGRARHQQHGQQAKTSEFPITLGRDFSGIVVDAGPAAGRKFLIGDIVYGTVAPHRQGSHAEYTVTSSDCIGHKPLELSDVEAASLPYIACTTYSALVYSGGVSPSNASQRRVLIIGAAGAIGTFAVQLLKAWNTRHIVALARLKGNIEQASSLRMLGADEVVDSSTTGGAAHYMQQLQRCGPFDMILDAAGDVETAQNCQKFMQNNFWSSRFVTLMSPVLRNTDRYSLLPGAALSAVDLAGNSLSALREGYQYRWGFYAPNATFLDRDLRHLITTHRLKPIVQQEFGFAEMPAAFHRMSERSLRGKIVLNMMRDATVMTTMHDDAELRRKINSVLPKQRLAL